MTGSPATRWLELAPIFAAHKADAYARIALEVAGDDHVSQLGEPLLILQTVRLAALSGRARDPWLGEPEPFRDFLRDHAGEVRDATAAGLVQFTDPARVTDLLPGLHLAAARYPGRPLNLIEIGACAGLLLAPERYRIDYPHASWDPAGATVRLRSEIDVPAARVGPALPIADRVGVDLQPVDPGDADSFDYLRSFHWPGDPARELRLRSALTALAADPVTVLRGDASEMLPDLLRARVTNDSVTVAIDSAMSQYLPQPAALRLGRALDASASRGPLLLLSRVTPDPPVPGLDSGVRLLDLSNPWRASYAASDQLSERGRWLGVGGSAGPDAGR